MKNGARDLRQRGEADRASGPREEPARESGSQPATRFYERLPLGSEAFVTPLAPIESVPPGALRLRSLGYILGAGAALAVIAIAVVSGSKSGPGQTSAAELRASRQAEPPADEANALEPTETVHQGLSQVPADEPSENVARAVAAVEAPDPTSARPELAPASAQPSQLALSEPAHARPKTADRAARARKSQGLDQPDRAQVIAAMNAVQPAVRECFGAARGAATAELKIVGRSGRVSSARVTGQPGAIGSCIARAVRKAHFPTFAAESLTISYALGR